MSGNNEARGMLLMARKDLRALRAMSGNPEFDDEIVGFHAQQAVEKALKAWIILVDLDYPITHSLITLMGVLEDRECDISEFRSLAKYTIFAVQFRYEPAEPLDVALNRAEAAGEVTALVDHVERLVERSNS
jgi:HEPN domain-containing protein